MRVFFGNREQSMTIYLIRNRKKVNNRIFVHADGSILIRTVLKFQDVEFAKEKNQANVHHHFFLKESMGK
jgi:uncharacterized protein YbcV (DUF1398 family)